MGEYFLGNHDLAPRQEDLTAILQAAGNVLKEKGTERLENGRYKIDDSGVSPANIFTYKLSPEIVHRLFSIPLENIRASSDGHAEECEISYLPESMLEDGMQCSAELGLYITEVVSRSDGLPPLYIEHSWTIGGWKGCSLKGTYKVEYSVNGRRISPSNLDLESLDLSKHEHVRTLIADIESGSRPLDAGDIKAIGELIDTISQSGIM